MTHSCPSFETENSLFYLLTFRAWKFDQRLNFEARDFISLINERLTCLLKYWYAKNEQLYEYFCVILDEGGVTCGRFASVRSKNWGSNRPTWQSNSWLETFVFHDQTPKLTFTLCNVVYCSIKRLIDKQVLMCMQATDQTLPIFFWPIC